jgi:hypothetical protein
MLSKRLLSKRLKQPNSSVEWMEDPNAGAASCR